MDAPHGGNPIMSGLARRIIITLMILAVPLVVGLLFTFQIIKIDWVSMMEIQPSFRAMEDPLPVPPNSVPIEGAAFVPGSGSPANPIPPDSYSLARGQSYYEINCALCHGNIGKGDGSVAEKLVRKPTDLTGSDAAQLSDGEIFMVITNGIHPGSSRKGGMPDLRENLKINDRWDVINYVRNLQGQ
jgi:mono/diheme cytochrome c family protein